MGSGDTSHMVAVSTRATGIIAHPLVTFTFREDIATIATIVTIDAGKLFSKKVKKVLDRVWNPCYIIITIKHKERRVV